MAKIEDGTGTGRRTRVTAENRLSVDSVSFRAEENAIRRGEGWQLAAAVPGVGHVEFQDDQQTAMRYWIVTGKLR